MKIAYVTIYDASDVHNWSGTGLFLSKSLIRQGADLVYIGSLKTQNNLYHRLKGKILKKLFGKNYLPDRQPGVAKNYARQIEARLAELKPDIVFSPGAAALGYVKTKIPMVIYTDATFRPMVGYYEKFSNLWISSYKNAEKLEQNAINNASLLFYSSDWAAQSAIELYHANPEKVKVITFGTNIENTNDADSVQKYISGRSTEKCTLLFMGVDWIRKGGALSLKIAQRLHEQGFPVELHIVGIKNLPLETIPSFVNYHGFVSKATEEGRQKLDHLLKNSHFLILPTQADCTPMVFAESNSYGLPCITTETGGIPTLIKNDVNGKRFPLDAPVDEYADYIKTTFSNRSKYEQLAQSSYREFATRLNWDVTGKAMMKEFETLLKKETSS
ncbi:MAG: glycosyltransferase family 4 protein [Lentimicrobiaceae bacterium]|nr:glycosyltransferase family 4 protein [Lentimicrobiaceae bacterium]